MTQYHRPCLQEVDADAGDLGGEGDEGGVGDREGDAESAAGDGDRAAARRRLLSRRRSPPEPAWEHYTTQPTGGRGCGGRIRHRVENENYTPDPGNVRREVRGPDEAVLMRCLRGGPHMCTAASRRAARRLLSVQMLTPVPPPPTLLGKGNDAEKRLSAEMSEWRRNPAAMLAPRASNGTHTLPALGAHAFGSCAVVGNAGHLTTQKWGKYVDNHDVIMRFNRQEVGGVLRKRLADWSTPVYITECVWCPGTQYVMALCIHVTSAGAL